MCAKPGGLAKGGVSGGEAGTGPAWASSWPAPVEPVAFTNVRKFEQGGGGAERWKGLERRAAEWITAVVLAVGKRSAGGTDEERGRATRVETAVVVLAGVAIRGLRLGREEREVDEGGVTLGVRS